MVKVRKFFCLDLITTGLVIGWLGIIGSTTAFFSFLLRLCIQDKVLINYGNYVHILNITICCAVFGPLIMGTEKVRKLRFAWLINLHKAQ